MSKYNNLKTDYKKGDWYTTGAANDTSQAILDLLGDTDTLGKSIKEVKTEKQDAISTELTTKSKTIVGAINELKAVSGKVELATKEDIEKLFS